MANIKFTYAAVTLLSLTTVANSISASNTFTNLTYAAAPARSISFTTEIVPTRSLADDSVSVTDSSFVLEITKVPGDSITVSDTPVMAVDIVRTDSVNVTDTPNKIINSSIDFDLSDSDVDLLISIRLALPSVSSANFCFLMFAERQRLIRD